MGRGIIEAGLFRSEQYGVKQRTSDPSDHKEGERWIRTDLAPEDDQIATYRFDMGSEVVDIPIYDTGATVDGVEKVRRVRVDGVTGFIPFAESGASYPQWGFQHAGTRLGAHDALEASAIPDSDVFHFDATELNLNDGDTVSSWSDLSSRSNDLSAVGGPTYEASAINGNPAVLYDGADDRHESENDAGTLSQPIVIYVVFQALDVSGTNRPFNFSDDGDYFEFNTESEWFMFAGSTVDGGSGDTDVHGAKLVYDGPDSELRLDGSSVATGDVGTHDLNNVSLGGRFQDDFFTNIRVGELIGYQDPDSQTQSDAESGLSDKWGVTL